jgi:hypothetical protein
VPPNAAPNPLLKFRGAAIKWNKKFGHRSLRIFKPLVPAAVVESNVELASEMEPAPPKAAVFMPLEESNERQPSPTPANPPPPLNYDDTQLDESNEHQPSPTLWTPTSSDPPPSQLPSPVPSIILRVPPNSPIFKFRGAAIKWNKKFGHTSLRFFKPAVVEELTSESEEMEPAPQKAAVCESEEETTSIDSEASIDSDVEPEGFLGKVSEGVFQYYSPYDVGKWTLSSSDSDGGKVSEGGLQHYSPENKPDVGEETSSSSENDGEVVSDVESEPMRSSDDDLVTPFILCCYRVVLQLLAVWI